MEVKTTQTELNATQQRCFDVKGVLAIFLVAHFVAAKH